MVRQRIIKAQIDWEEERKMRTCILAQEIRDAIQLFTARRNHLNCILFNTIARISNDFLQHCKNIKT